MDEDLRRLLDELFGPDEVPPSVLRPCYADATCRWADMHYGNHIFTRTLVMVGAAAADYRYVQVVHPKLTTGKFELKLFPQDVLRILERRQLCVYLSGQRTFTFNFYIP